jgi:hypothetical protein
MRLPPGWVRIALALAVCVSAQSAAELEDGAMHCPLGQFPKPRPLDGKRFCVACEFGHFCLSNGLQSCPPGKYQNQPHVSSCKGCPQGKHQPLSGESHCVACPAGLFSELSGNSPGHAVHCKQCPGGKFSEYRARGTAECDLCKRGTFSDGCADEISTQGCLQCTNCAAGEPSSPEPLQQQP